MRVKEKQGGGGSQVLDGVGNRGRIIRPQKLQPCLAGRLEKNSVGLLDLAPAPAVGSEKHLLHCW